MSAVIFISGFLAGKVLTEAQAQSEETEKEIFGETNFRGLTVYDTNREPWVFEKKTEKTSIIVYEKAGCGSCIEALPQVKRIMEVLSPIIDVKIIWQGTLPYQDIEKNGIEKNRNYQMPKDFLLDLSSPTYYVLDYQPEAVLFIFGVTVLVVLFTAAVSLSGINYRNLVRLLREE